MVRARRLRSKYFMRPSSMSSPGDEFGRVKDDDVVLFAAAGLQLAEVGEGVGVGGGEEEVAGFC